jgi:hypothetical protein
VTFKERHYVCNVCGVQTHRLAWNTDPSPVCGTHGSMFEVDHTGAVAPGVVDDTTEWRCCETMGHEPFWYNSKTALRREAERRGVVNVVRHEESYYARARRQHDERLRDTGQK